MKNLERKKYKRLKINLLILIVFLIQTLMVVGFSNSKSFAASKYPLSYIMDTYLFISLLMNPILVSSLAKKVIEIEEKNKMWQMQIMLGGRVNTILINKFKILSIKLVFLQLIEAIVFILAARKGVNFSLGKEVLIRFLVFNLSVIVINLFFLAIFMILEMKVKKVYALSFISIVGGLTGVITMLTSQVLAYINPFAWMASLLNISYVNDGGRFIQILNPINPYTLIIAFTLLILSLVYLKSMTAYNLYKD